MVTKSTVRSGDVERWSAEANVAGQIEGRVCMERGGGAAGKSRGACAGESIASLNSALTLSFVLLPSGSMDL